MLLPVEPAELALLAGATFVAALVRGFCGFGSGLVYLPVAGQVLSPVAAITTIVIFDLIGPLPLLRRAARDCDPGDLGRLIAGLVVALPLGLLALTRVPPELFRSTVSVVALVLLACLISGVRYRRRPTAPMVYATGGVAGFLQGVAGIPGPPVILLYMASTLPSRVIRGNTLLFLFLTEFAFIPALALFGRLEGSAVVLGMLLILPNLAGGLTGAWLFRPEHERAYRWAAYAIIGASALSGLALWP